MEYLSFKLPDEFIDAYKDRVPNFGFSIGGGNKLGEIVFFSNYSRLKEDGIKERWYEACRRVIEGYYSILKDHCVHNKTYWNELKALASAKDAYDRMFSFKWLPPGRGIWAMGTRAVNEERNAAMLYNCAYVTTAKVSSHSMHNATFPFVRLMEMSMNGIGVGFDARGAGNLILNKPSEERVETFVVPDTREGWAQSLGVLLASYFFENRPKIIFDYSQLRAAGSPLKRFGGTASGPEPLIKMHTKISELLLADAGKPISSHNIVDIMNLAAKAVVSGGSRRSALIALGEADDKEYINLKNWETYPERNGEDGWSHLSNNSILAEVGKDYGHLIDLIADNGEPGLIYLDMIRNYGRTGDPPDGKDQKVMGVNPCQPAWAPVVTPYGISTIGKINVGDEIWSEDGFVRVTKKWSTGVKPVFQYETTAGRFYGTENHRLVSNGVKLEAKDCETVDALIGPRHLVMDKYDAELVMDGLVLGDGMVHKASNDLVLLCIGKNDNDYFDDPSLAELIGRERYGISEHAWEINTSITAEELVRTYDRTVPDRFFYAPPEVVASFLRGLYSANGSVVGDGRVTLKSSSKKLIEQVQMMLSSLGIRSYYTTNKPTNVEFSNGEYTCKESYDLNVSTDRARFFEFIGFVQNYKMDKLFPFIQTSGISKSNFDIKEITHLGDEEVFDITVSGSSHTYWTGGLNVSNCAEIGLESNELCNLSELFPTNHEDLDDFKRSIKHAYMYNKAVTLLPTAWPETNEVINRNRRIGLSVSGTVQFLETRPGGHTEFIRWLDEAYKEVLVRDVQYSEWLGIRESIRHTTSKPSGSVSILAGVTPGANTPTDNIYIRRMRMRKDSDFVKILAKAGYVVEDDVMDPDNTVVVEFPTLGVDTRTEKEVSIWEKASIAAMVQKHFADNAVSCTITFSQAEKNQIGAVLRTFEGQLKTISFLPISETGTIYKQMPYEAISKEECEKLQKSIKQINWNKVYNGNYEDAEGDSYCTTDRCEIPVRT